MTLPYDYSRCVGRMYWSIKPPLGQTEKMDSRCNDCRRREPSGHPTRQVYLAPELDETGYCPNRIAPE